MNLTPKDLTLNWKIKVSAHRGSSGQDPDMLLMKRIDKREHEGLSTNSKIVDFKPPVIKKYFNENTEVFKVALSFEKNCIIMVFDPPANVPSYKLSHNGKGKMISNTDLIEEIYDHFKLDKTKTKYYLKINWFDELNNMRMYKLTPWIYETKMPVFEDELKSI